MSMPVISSMNDGFPLNDKNQKGKNHTRRVKPEYFCCSNVNVMPVEEVRFVHLDNAPQSVEDEADVEF